MNAAVSAFTLGFLLARADDRVSCRFSRVVWKEETEVREVEGREVEGRERGGRREGGGGEGEGRERGVVVATVIQGSTELFMAGEWNMIVMSYFILN